MDMWKCLKELRQLPVADEDTLVFWEGCRRGRLLIQQCDDCHAFRFPPSPLCSRCCSSAATWREDPGHGEILTFCVYHSELAGPAWRDRLPYVVAVVELAHSRVRMLGNLAGVGAGKRGSRAENTVVFRDRRWPREPAAISPVVGPRLVS